MKRNGRAASPNPTVVEKCGSPDELYRDEGGEESGSLKNEGEAEGYERVDTSGNNSIKQELLEHTLPT